ncbi:unnamed protein product [Spodoptera exigua]|nr:unnamed protein product [Spodoptera exigua]
MEAIQSSVQSPKVKSSEEMSEVKSEVLVKLEDDGDEVMSKGSQRENRLTSIIDQLRCQSKLKEERVCTDAAGSRGAVRQARGGQGVNPSEPSVAPAASGRPGCSTQL